MGEVTTKIGFEGRVTACQVATWEKSLQAEETACGKSWGLSHGWSCSETLQR